MIYPTPNKLTLPVIPEYVSVPEYKAKVVELQSVGLFGNMSDEQKRAVIGGMMIIGAGIVAYMLAKSRNGRNKAFQVPEPKPLKRKKK